MTTPAADTTTTVLKGMYAAEAEYLAAGGPDTASLEIMAPFFAPDVVLHQADGLPYGGTWRGHDGMEQFFVAMSRTWTSSTWSNRSSWPPARLPSSLTQIHARARATGTELDFPILQTLRIRDGRIADVRPFYWDTAAIAAACG
jgi:uncharacterized protein